MQVHAQWMCQCVCVGVITCVTLTLMNIFLPFSPRGRVIDRTLELFHVPATKLH